ncbi:hypothetical protein EVAR_64973_1 [Eumeta japonica]|uniref:Uncharacterized protein n=1 Tax=Eumeta variegata TaxID=151549 RepID=A0A4C1ZNR1_EUMVA|nr:hypothetical protein EVAR_64973_1 [Eumeta japonica]
MNSPSLTNRLAKGLSLNRSQLEAVLLLTTPRQERRSSTDDSGPRPRTTLIQAPGALRIVSRYRFNPRRRVGLRRRTLRIKRYPTDGSLAPPAARPSARPNVRYHGYCGIKQYYYREDAPSVG